MFEAFPKSILLKGVECLKVQNRSTMKWRPNVNLLRISRIISMP